MFHNSLVLTMDFVITNVKISVKIRAKPLNIVEKVLKAKNILCETHNNFPVAKSCAPEKIVAGFIFSHMKFSKL